MSRSIGRVPACFACIVMSVAAPALAAPTATLDSQRLTVTARDYRIALHRYQADFTLELRDRGGQWRLVTRRGASPEFAISDNAGLHESLGSPGRLRHAAAGDGVVVGLITVLPGPVPTLARIDLFCTDDGLLVRFLPESNRGDDRATCWAIPRLLLDETVFDAYTYWRTPDEARSGRIADLGASEASLVPQAHAMGALFGGGITCSALYHGENGLSEQQVLDMATRGPAGQLVAAWNEPNCRHGSLSSPAYLDYLLSSCKRQIDAGTDYLFMDEISAALQDDEGFDDHSIAAFREFLLDRFVKRGWTPRDPRWRDTFEINLADPVVAPDGTMATFHYRAYLKARGLAAKPHAVENPLANEWHAFRDARDERAWKWLTDAIRAHASARGQRVLISANGVARHVDLQVLGVWENWKTTGGRVDLSENQIEQWRSTVIAGVGLAGRKVPVVLFHDWGFGGFPWMEVSPEDRRLWMRVRGAEIYAAGGFFAFPVHGPFGNDARQDGTLAEVARQSAFYHRHEDLYLNTELLGFEPLATDESALSLALWRRASPPAWLLHVINRRTADGKIAPRCRLAVRLPIDRAPRQVRIASPDRPGETLGSARSVDRGVTVELPGLEAYSVAILDYDALPAVKLHGRHIVASPQWSRPARNEFVVEPGGLIRDQWALPGLLQGNLHRSLRNPPCFLVNMPRGGTMQLHVQGVATLGARLQWTIDGKPETPIDLPDRDGKNDALAHEYDRTFDLTIPPGRHTIALDNVGGDWACIGWYAFGGESQ